MASKAALNTTETDILRKNRSDIKLNNNMRRQRRTGKQFSVAVPRSIGSGTPTKEAPGSDDPLIRNTVDHGTIGLVSENVDLSELGGNFHSMILSDNISITFTGAPDSPKVQRFIVHIKQDGSGGNTVTWNNLTSSAPTIDTAANAITNIEIYTFDGGTTYHAIQGSGGSGPGGASFPLDYSVDDQGTKSSGTVTHDLSASTAHMLKFTIGGDLTVAFSNYPASGTGIDWYVEVTQDGTGGHTIQWPLEVNPTISLTETAGTVSMIAFHTNDGGTTVRSITLLNAVATAVTNLSNIIVDTDFDADGTYKYILDTDGDTYLIADTDDRIEFFTAGTEKLRLDTELQLQGGVKLDLNGNDLVFGTGVGEYMDHGASSDIRVYTASTHRLSFNATGQLMEAGYRLTMEDEIRFTPITKPVSNTSAKIYAEDLTNDELVLNAPTSGKVRVDVAGTTAAEFATSSALLEYAGVHTTTISNTLTPTVDDGEIGRIDWQGLDHLGGGDIFASIRVEQSDITSTSEDGRIIIGVIDGGVRDDTFMLLESINASGSKLTIQADQKDFDVEIVRGESTSSTGKIGAITFDTNNSSSSIRSFGEIRVDADVVTAGSERSDVTFKAYDEGTYVTFLRYIGGTGIQILGSTTEQLGFYGSAGSNKQTVTGSRGGNAALQGLLAALANLGLITDSST